jgi:hypothetical protein
MNNYITPDYVARFIETTEKQIKDLEEKIKTLETDKLLTTEKNEHLIYKFNVLQEKVNASEQKVNELNNIMMKHFAYKANILPPITPTTLPPISQTVPQQTTNLSQQPFMFNKT